MSATKGLFLQERERESFLTSNKATRDDFAKGVIQEVAEGYADPTKILLMAKKAVEVFTVIEKNVKPFVAGRGIQKGGLTLYDATITEKKDADKYDYSACNDSKINELYAKFEEIKKDIRDRETFLKTLKEPMSTLEGEIINPPAVTHGAQNISVTLK